MLTAAEVRQELRIGRDKFRELVRSGQLAAIKTSDAPNAHYRVSEESVAAYKARREQQAAGAA